MKQSNFSRLIKRYVTQKTSKRETGKIEAMLETVGKRNIHFISKETEELMFSKIKSKSISQDEITRFVRSLCKVRVREVKWLRLEPFEVYFSKETI